MHVILHMGDIFSMNGPNAKRMRVFRDVLVAKGHNVTILAPKNPNRNERYPDVKECAAIPLKSKSPVNRLMNGLSFAVSSVFAAFGTGKCEVVLTTSPPPLISISGWLIAKIKRAKLVYDVRDIWPDVAWEMGSFTPDSSYSKAFACIRNFMLRHADLVTTVSPGKVKKLQTYRPEAKVIHVPNGLDETFLQNKENAQVVQMYKMDEQIDCTYIGNLGLAQGLTQLLQVAKRANETEMPVRFLLFGSGVEEAELKKFAQENSLDNVVFAGRIPNQDIYTVLKHSQMSFVSLVNDKLCDSVPTKMFEALGVGCPVLLAAVGDSADILAASGLGISVPPNQAEELWSAFCQMYQNLSQYEKAKESGIAYILRNYSRQLAAEKLEQELQTMVGVKTTV